MQLSSTTGRFAPSITGLAHTGTLLAALLAWLDARSLGGRVVLRLEDLDETRLREGQASLMVEALEWLGLDWDEVEVQSEHAHRHEAALDRLASLGSLYPCSCSRKQWRARGGDAPDGGKAYDNHCRNNPLPAGGWRASTEALRVQLPDRYVSLEDSSGLDLSQRPAIDMGDPVVRRRDGVMAYHLVVVVDDAAIGVDRVVRGRDLASSTATQVLLQELLGYSQPHYRHHLLLLESADHKLAKMRGSIPYDHLKAQYSGPQLCAMLASLAGLSCGSVCTPHELLPSFSWERVVNTNVLWRA